MTKLFKVKKKENNDPELIKRDIIRVSKERGKDPDTIDHLLRIVQSESTYDRFAKNPNSSALGPFQLLKAYGTDEERTNPVTATHKALDLIESRQKRGQDPYADWNASRNKWSALPRMYNDQNVVIGEQTSTIPKLFKEPKQEEHPIAKVLQAKVNESQHNIYLEHEPQISRMKKEYLARKEALRKKWKDESFKAKTEKPALEVFAEKEAKKNPSWWDKTKEVVKGGIQAVKDIKSEKLSIKDVAKEIPTGIKTVHDIFTPLSGDLTYQEKADLKNLRNKTELNQEEKTKLSELEKKNSEYIVGIAMGATEGIKNVGKNILKKGVQDLSPLVREGADEIKRVSNNILKNNPGISLIDAEAMAKDVIENSKFNQSKPSPLIQEAKNESVITKGFTDIQATAKNQPVQTAKPTVEKIGLSQSKTARPKTLGSELDNIVDSTPSQATPSSYEKIRNWFKESKTSLRETVQDNWLRVKKLQENPTVKQNEKLNPYDAEILYHGRVGARLEAVKDEARNIDKDILETAKKLGEKDQTLKGVINKYLVAKHAPERNLQHGGGAAGMTTDKAKEIIQKVEGTSASSEIKRISQSIKDINDTTLEILKDGQVISDETYQTLKNTYKNHVPLQRIFNETEDVNDLLINRGLNVKGTGIKRAKGSQREVSDILGNVVANVEQAVVRAEKNRVNLATLEFARNNPDLGLFEEIKPKAIGETFEKDGVRKPIVENIADPLVLHVREQGKPVYLKIKDEHLAQVFQGIGNDKLPPVMRFISGFTRLYSGLATRFNPEFSFSNKVRDIQEMAVYMAAQKDIGFSGAAKTGFRDLASMKSVVEGLAGKETEGAKLYQQMKLDGGTTGGMALSTKKAVDIDMEKLAKLNRSNTRKAGEYLLNAVDSWNTVFEDSTRLSVYKTALDKGLSRDAAAVLAKTSTVNFNKKGTGGPIINAIWMFSNASIQGTAKFMQSMKNPKVAGAVATAVGGSVFAVNKWNDSVDPDWRDKVTKWDRINNMVVMYPSSEGAKYFTIPVSWALKPMKVASDYASDLVSGKNTGSVASNINKLVGATLDAYNPIGGTDVTSAITPTVLDLPIEIARNKQWTGSPIKPDWKGGLPKSDQFYDTLSKSWLGQQLIKATQTLSENSARTIDISPADANYAISQMIGGAGRAVSGVINTITSASKGETPQARETPFLRRFFKSRSEEEIQKSQLSQQGGNFYDALKQLKTGSEEQKLLIQDYLASVPDDSLRSKEAFKIREMGFDMKGIKTSKKSIDALSEQPVFDHIRNLVKEGKTHEAESIVKFMPDDEYEKYKTLRNEWRSDNTKQFKDALESNPVEAVKYARSLDKDEGMRIIKNLSDEEYAIYEKAKNELDGK